MAIVAAVVHQLPLERTDITASYRVDGDTIVLLEGTAEQWHADAWDRWVELVPSSARWNVGRFDALAGSLDGQVEPLSDSRQVWTLRIAELDDDLRDVALVHELGHLISLGPDQIAPITDEATDNGCLTYLATEGCPIEGSMVERFLATFWEPGGEWESGRAVGQARYAADPSAYVTPYAATNPGEDIAETFLYFVYSLEPTGTTVADQKIRLLWEFPELVELREWLRRGLLA